MISASDLYKYMLRQYGLEQSECAPSYDFMFIQQDGQGRRVKEMGIVQAGVLKQIVAHAASVQEAGNAIIEVLKHGISQGHPMQPQAPAPVAWNPGQLVTPAAIPMAPQPVQQPMQQQGYPQGAPQAQPQIPQPPQPQMHGTSPEGFATSAEMAAMSQNQEADGLMNPLLGAPQPPMTQDPLYGQAMQQAQQAPMPLQPQPMPMDPNAIGGQNQAPHNRSREDVSGGVFAVGESNEAPPNPNVGEAPF